MKRTRGSSYLVLLIDLNKLMDNEGYPLKGSMKDNIETLKRYGKYRNKDSNVLVVNDIISRLDKGGYKWID